MRKLSWSLEILSYMHKRNGIFHSRQFFSSLKCHWDENKIHFRRRSNPFSIRLSDYIHTYHITIFWMGQIQYIIIIIIIINVVIAHSTYTYIHYFNFTFLLCLCIHIQSSSHCIGYPPYVHRHLNLRAI